MPTTTITTRTCPTCGKSYPLTPEYFHRNRTEASGLCVYCKPCRIQHHRRWRAAHKAQISEYNHARYVKVYAARRRRARLERAFKATGVSELNMDGFKEGVRL